MKPAIPSPRRKSDWPPLVWLGCDVRAWVRLLLRHRFAVHRSRCRPAALVTALSPINTILGLVQQAFYSRRVRRTRIVHAPIFVVGHWRSGTTLLHELLACDPRNAFPTTYQCTFPHHFLLTGSWLPGLLGRVLPSRRPMDNMAMGWDRPQEDEFALCLLGQPSPYERVAFPNQPAPAGTLDLTGLSPQALMRWKAVFFQLVQQLTLAQGGRRLVLKSPAHACRIPRLLELFPDARFVHIIRDPYVIYPSTLHLGRVLWTAWGLQRPSWQDLPEFILATFTQFYDRFEEGKRVIPPRRLHEVRYEDLVRDPLRQLEALYRALDLDDFEVARPPVDAYVATWKGYETNRYVLTPAEREAVTDRWGDVIRRYGYEVRR